MASVGWVLGRGRGAGGQGGADAGEEIALGVRLLEGTAEQTAVNLCFSRQAVGVVAGELQRAGEQRANPISRLDSCVARGEAKVHRARAGKVKVAIVITEC